MPQVLSHPLGPAASAATTFQQLLVARYIELRGTIDGGFSYRDFARKAGFGSPNYLKLVMDGDRNLSPASFPKFLVGLYVSPSDEAFVRSLYLAGIAMRINNTEAA